jgi:hypothetical protein
MPAAKRLSQNPGWSEFLEAWPERRRLAGKSKFASTTAVAAGTTNAAYFWFAAPKAPSECGSLLPR